MTRSEPWNADIAAPLFADQQRVFTTATVVAALGALEEGASDSAVLVPMQGMDGLLDSLEKRRPAVRQQQK